MAYKFRNGSIVDATHCIVGVEVNTEDKWVSAGVQEWCYSLSDAEYILKKMQKFPRQFKALEIQESTFRLF